LAMNDRTGNFVRNKKAHWTPPPPLPATRFTFTEQSLQVLGREPLSYRLFERTAQMGMSFSERYPWATFAAVALALLAFIVAAEVEYLTKAGFRWR